MDSYPEKSFEIAAKWWADNVYRQQAKQDNGDAQTALLVALTRDDHPELPEEKIKQFESALVDELKSEWKPGRTLFLSVDYAPCMTLVKAAELAGTPCDGYIFPMKTSMWIEASQVSVRYGYTGQMQDLIKNGITAC
jgi:hypothetical protein